MKLPHRRQFLHLAAGAAALPAVSRFALAQTYPTRPVRIVVGLAPGGTNDIVARLMGQWLSERLCPPILHRNPPTRVRGPRYDGRTTAATHLFSHRVHLVALPQA